MVIVNLLKRRDGSSVVVAVALGLIVFNLVSAVAEPLAGDLTGRNQTLAGDWQTLYLYPAVLAVLEIVALEIVGWIYVWLNGALRQK